MLTATQRNTVHRIDRERSSCAGIVRTRLIRRAAALATEARRGAPIAPDAFAETLIRPAMIAYLRGMKRTVLDASRALRQDVRGAHLTLARDDEDDDRDLLLFLLLWLGLGTTAVEAVRARATRVAYAASRELTGTATRKLAQAVAEGRAASVLETGNVATLKTDTVSVLPRATPKPQGSVVVRQGDSVFGTFGKSDIARFVGPAFDRAGIGKVSRHNLDTWAETVAYEQYEAGRFDAGDTFPAVSEALWGYRWSSILDTRTTAGCRGLDGYVAPVDDPWIQALRPPRHWNCRSVLVPVYQSSALRKPQPSRPPDLTDADLQRYLRQKEEFMRRVA